MTYSEVFSYALVLKGGERTDAILELLEPARRQQVKTAQEMLNRMPPDLIWRDWLERRFAEERSKPAGE